jgi:demethylmenaquinone methyltransferase / 2-methoxy-6-polyprenyl-1,4-benzoquinol methylase
LQEQLAGSEKERYINNLFATIAPKYDLLNSVISLGRHRSWRRKAVAMSGLDRGGKAIDVATGTGDFAIELGRAVGDSGTVIGSDFCQPMLELAARKTAHHKCIHLTYANAEALPFESNTFDCATIGFALRNVSSVPATLAEMTRVVRPGGRVVSLEMVRPTSRLIAPLWRLYFFKMMPGVAGMLGGEREPYDYLPQSVARFHSREELAGVFEDCGLRDVAVRTLTLGLVCIHMGIKR